MRPEEPAHRAAYRIRAAYRSRRASTFTLRQTYKEWTSGMTAEDARAGVEYLVSRGYVQTVKGSTGGRPSEFIHVHPGDLRPCSHSHGNPSPKPPEATLVDPSGGIGGTIPREHEDEADPPEAAPGGTQQANRETSPEADAVEATPEDIAAGLDDYLGLKP